MDFCVNILNGSLRRAQFEICRPRIVIGRRASPSLLVAVGAVAFHQLAVADGASRQGKMCWMTSVCFCTAENCCTLSSTLLSYSQAWETGASRKRTVNIARLNQAEPQMALLNHKCGHHLPEGLRYDFHCPQHCKLCP